LFTVDAPLAQDFRSDESDQEILHGDDSEEEDLEVGDEDQEESDDNDESDEDDDSDSAPEFDGASDIDEDGEGGQYEEKGANAPIITIPDGVVDFDAEEDVKGKGKAVWHDAADDRISVDMEKDNRLKKLARGKKGGVVDGQELQKRLKQQYVLSSSSARQPS
jgi:hypothetical protein